MIWYKESNDPIILSSRVRYARNFEGIPFPHKLNDNKKVELSEKIRSIFLDNPEYSAIDFSAKSKNEQGSYLEMHLCSPNFVSGNASGRSLIVSKGEEVSVMVNEEDHLRIQAITPALSLEKAYNLANSVTDYIGEKAPSAGLSYAFLDKYGYLTACPTNVGGGVRASVMMHLPGIVMCGKLQNIGEQLGLRGYTIRGFYGEGSNAVGALFQISNMYSLGQSDLDMIKALKEVVLNIKTIEEKSREALKENDKDVLYDKISRSVGILRYAHRLASKEMISLLSDYKLGLWYGLFSDTDYQRINQIQTELMPSCLALLYENAFDAEERDVIRAKEMKKRLT